jgi:NTE family protein
VTQAAQDRGRGQGGDADGPVRINLALQGGGAHGAFTWGVIERLLDDPRIEIAGISGTSAGALNGAALKSGLVQGGRKGARENLAWLWAQVGAVNDMRLTSWMTALGPAPGLFTRMLEYSLPWSWMDAVTRVLSPYDYGVAYRNPLQRIVERFDFANVCAETGPAFFVSATNVRTGKIRVFARDEITTDVILASACLPTIFQAVEFTDPRTGQLEAFWDGGYAGNPALFPLFDRSLPDDILIVNINPLRREDLPRSAREIQNRINEISFNSSLLRELRAINFASELIDGGQILPDAMKRVRVHIVSDDGLMNKLSAVTKLAPSPLLLHQLREAGRAAGDAFLEKHGRDLGHVGTANLPEMFG